ncbi:MAG: ParA family protein [Planctomycetota bacterium]|jgi:cellulose biosynthesis protein BcsQ
MRVIACYSIKGGVGKTSTTVNLSHLSAMEGVRTLVWDLDPQGAASFCFRIKPRVKGGGERLVRGKVALKNRVKGTDFDDLDLLPADFSYRHLDLALDRTKKPVKRVGRVLAPTKKRYERVFLDCAPSISLVSESVFRASDVLLVPVIPTPLSMRTLERLISALEKVKGKNAPRVLPFFCMADRRKSLHRNVLKDPGELAPMFLKTTIPYSATVEQMTVRRQPVTAFSPRSAPAKAYRALWEEIREVAG